MQLSARASLKGFPGNLALTLGLCEEGILVFQLALAQGKCISPPSVGWTLRAQPLSCFSWDFSYSCCTEQNQSNTRQGNINTRNLGPP